MKTNARTKSLRAATKSRFNQIRRELEVLTALLDPETCGPFQMTTDERLELRNRVEKLNQAAHEYNAYSNAYAIITGSDK